MIEVPETWSQGHLRRFWRDASIPGDYVLMHRSFDLPPGTTRTGALELADRLLATCPSLRSHLHDRDGVVRILPRADFPELEVVELGEGDEFAHPFFRGRMWLLSQNERPVTVARVGQTFKIWLCVSHLFVDGTACAKIQSWLLDMRGTEHDPLHHSEIASAEESNERLALRSAENVRTLVETIPSEPWLGLDTLRRPAGFVTYVPPGALERAQSVGGLSPEGIALVCAAELFGVVYGAAPRIMEMLGRLSLPARPVDDVCTNGTFPCFIGLPSELASAGWPSVMTGLALRSRARGYVDPGDPTFSAWHGSLRDALMVNVHHVPPYFDEGGFGSPAAGPYSMDIPERAAMLVDVALFPSGAARLTVVSRTALSDIPNEAGSGFFELVHRPKTGQQRQQRRIET